VTSQTRCRGPQVGQEEDGTLLVLLQVVCNEEMSHQNLYAACDSQGHVMECSHVAIIYLPKAFSCHVFNYRKSMRHLKARIADKWNSLVSPTCTRLYLCASGLFVVPRLCDAR